MRPRAIAASALAAAVVVMGLIFWSKYSGPGGKAQEAERILSKTFGKFGLTEETVTRRLITQEKLGSAKYFRSHVEYEAPRSFPWKVFEQAVRNALGPTRFRVTKSDYIAKKDRDCYALNISRGDYNVLELRINKRRAPAAPPEAKRRRTAKIAIVIDDFGYNTRNLKKFLDIGRPLTFSILPNQPHSREVAAQARLRGCEAILHLPLESWRGDVKEEPATIRSGMGESEIAAKLDKELAGVPGVDGVSNHMGSKSTEDKKLMTDVFKYLKRHNLYFFDSLTSPRSVCREVAAEVGVNYVRRDRFLDNANDIASIEKQLLDLRDLAFARGKVTAVCHDRPNTATALARMMPELAEDGIEFVLLSDIVAKKD